MHLFCWFHLLSRRPNRNFQMSPVLLVVPVGSYLILVALLFDCLLNCWLVDHMFDANCLKLPNNFHFEYDVFGCFVRWTQPLIWVTHKILEGWLKHTSLSHRFDTLLSATCLFFFAFVWLNYREPEEAGKYSELYARVATLPWQIFFSAEGA